MRLLCVTGVVFGVVVTGASNDVLAAAPSPISVHVHLTGGSQPIPASFLGLSMEYTGVESYAEEGPLFDRVVSMIRPKDGSPIFLRIGGKSADHAYWETSTSGALKSVFELDGQWMSELSALVKRDHMRVLLDLNLAVHSPALAVSFAEAARKALPPGTLAGMEIGNEPDLYRLQKDFQEERIPSTIASIPVDWQRDYSASDYRRDYIAYARALHAALPNVPLGGPETISDKPQWLAAIEGLGPLNPGFLTIHRYASSNCWPTSSPFYPTIGLMLSPGASAGLAGTVRGAVLYAHHLHQALRLTEVNSISCGGNTGVADSFATALWAPDVLFQMISEGVDGVSWHIRTTAVNAPFNPSPQGIIAKPELYGLAAFAQMTGPGARLLATRVTTSGAVNLSAWVVRSQQGLKVLVINKGGRPARVTLDFGYGTAQVRRLSAPTIVSSTGITLGGQSIGTNAEWQGKRVVSSVPGATNGYSVSVSGFSAALVSF